MTGLKRYLLTTCFMLSSLVLLPSLSLSHWEDYKGCKDTYYKIKGLPAEWEKLYEGTSEDGRDYIVRHKHSSGLINEEHYMLLPLSQWKDKQVPEHLEEPISEWLDWDGDGVYSEWYLFPRGKADCEDALHFVWDDKAQTYKLYATGKERT